MSEYNNELLLEQQAEIERLRAENESQANAIAAMRQTRDEMQKRLIQQDERLAEAERVILEISKMHLGQMIEVHKIAERYLAAAEVKDD